MPKTFLSRVLALGVIATLVWFALMSSTTQFDTYTEAATIAQDAQNFDELETRFEELAHEKGGAYAFEVLKRASLPLHTDLHLLGHAVGNVLYEQEGVGGIAVCTQDFRNACSHSIVIGALNDFGEGALSMIRDACKEAPGGPGAYTMCYHGLGHGVFAYFGYELKPTVDFCRKTGTSEYRDREYIECVGGAVMELMGGGGHDRTAWSAARETYLDPERPLAPCLDAIIPDEAKGQCLVYLTPRIWELAGIRLGAPNAALFAQAFSYCDVIPPSEQHLRDACYGGFGKEFFPIVAGRDVRDEVEYSEEQLMTVAEWCGYAAAEDGKQACIADAVASAFWGGEKDPATAFRLCAAAAAEGLGTRCYARLASDIASYTDSSRRAELCAQLPQEAQRYCTAGAL